MLEKQLISVRNNINVKNTTDTVKNIFYLNNLSISENRKVSLSIGKVILYNFRTIDFSKDYDIRKKKNLISLRTLI